MCGEVFNTYIHTVQGLSLKMISVLFEGNFKIRRAYLEAVAKKDKYARRAFWWEYAGRFQQFGSGAGEGQVRVVDEW